MAVVARVLPFFLAICAGLIAAFVIFFRLYIKASSSLKAMSGASTSRLLAHVSETLQGMAVIQAYEAEPRFMSENKKRLSHVTAAANSLDALQIWLSFRLDTIASLMVLSTCLLCVGLRTTISAASAGLAIR
jgi:ABC-type bacteriocin/lantibiotic exporter with double-glycine peptidase domain